MLLFTTSRIITSNTVIFAYFKFALLNLYLHRGLEIKQQIAIIFKSKQLNLTVKFICKFRQILFKKLKYE